MATKPKPYDLAAARRAIRAECGKQGIDDDARRAMMKHLAGVDSSTKLNADGARKVLDHLRVGQAPQRPKHEWTFVDTATADRKPLLKKIIMLMKVSGIAKGGQVRYVEGIARQMSGVPGSVGTDPVVVPLALCSAGQLWRIVAALEIHNKRTAKAAVAAV